MTRLLLLAALLAFAGCTAAADPSMEGCEALCARQGQKVSEYRVGTAVPIFKPHPSVVCACR